MVEQLNFLKVNRELEKTKIVRSPLFYVGDKYKLMSQLIDLFPENINNYFDVFCGGGSASINVKAENYYLNDIDRNIISLHNHLKTNSIDIEDFINRMYELISNYGLSHSEKSTDEKLEEYKKKYVKTYFAKYNKEAYLNLRFDFNNNHNNDLLYLLLIYGFNHMIRFNKYGEFNLPVGNLDWNKNVTEALINYAHWVNNNKVSFNNLDFEEFINSNHIASRDFIYLDPPYLITFSDYNKLWNEQEEKRLYDLLDELDKKNLKWGLSNILRHKNKFNNILYEWSKKYKVYNVKSNYISRFDNSIKMDSREVYITNYEKNRT